MTQKSIAYFPSYVANNGNDILRDFLKGAKKHGMVPLENNMEADCAVIWSVLWNGRLAGNQRIYEHYKHFQKPVFIIDVGALKRNVTWKVAINNINGNGIYNHTTNLDLDRPKKLGLELKTQSSNNGKILIAAQHRRSEQVKNLNIENWINQSYSQLQSITDRPIVVRSHPRCPLDNSKLDRDIVLESPKKVKNSYDDYDLSYNWHTIVNYNSGPGIQGAINGCYVITNESSLAYPVSLKISDLAYESPIHLPRDNWLISIAHTEYTQQELEQGLWAKRLLES